METSKIGKEQVMGSRRNLSLTLDGVLYTAGTYNYNTEWNIRVSSV